jgi:hypothetical protein
MSQPQWALDVPYECRVCVVDWHQEVGLCMLSIGSDMHALQNGNRKAHDHWFMAAALRP